MNPLIKTLLYLIATLPAAYAASIKVGVNSSNSIGTDAVDVQSQTASGPEGPWAAYGTRSIAIGSSNYSNFNYADEAVTIGVKNYISSGSRSLAIGYQNHIQCEDATWNPGDPEYVGPWWTPGDAYTIEPSTIAVGSYNYIGMDTQNSSNPTPYTTVVGIFNYVGGSHSSVVGYGNTLAHSVTNASVFGSGITNYLSNSMMIGPSNAAKVTIVASGNVGLGLGDVQPLQKLDVGGNIRLSGSIMKAGGGTLNLPASGTLTLPSGGGTLISSTGSQSITGATTVVTLGGTTAATQTKIDGITGNVGIGTTTPPAAKLDVAGTVNITGTLTQAGIQSVPIYARGSTWANGGRTVYFNSLSYSSPTLGPDTTTPNRGLAVLVINRSTLTVESNVNYDTYNSDTARTAMADALNALPNTKFLVVTSTDAWRVNAALKAALLNAGASPAVFEATDRRAYALLGIPGIGAGNGMEVYNEVYDGAPLTAISTTFTRPAALTSTPYEWSNRKDNTFLKNDGAVAFTTPVNITNTLAVNGAVQIAGSVTIKNVGTVKSVIRISPAGDIPMIDNPVGINPN